MADEFRDFLRELYSPEVLETPSPFQPIVTQGREGRQESKFTGPREKPKEGYRERRNEE